MDRRTFLTSTGWATLGGTLASVPGARRPVALPRRSGAASPATGAALPELTTMSSREGRLDVTLRIAPTLVSLGTRTAHVNTYNGQLPGPILRIRPGDLLRIRLVNEIAPLGVVAEGQPPPAMTRPNEHHGGAPSMAAQLFTNIHTHGLQVSPQDPADNVFLRIPPGQLHQYEYRIPDDHPAGLHWYHPHYHGSTTHQAWQGLAGAIVVEGDIDQVPEVAEARERVMVLNALRLDDRGEVPMALLLPNAGWSAFTSIPAVPANLVFTLNGAVEPTVDIRPGETQRWRVLNAAPHRTMWLHVDGHTLYQIGQDGVPFAKTKPVRSVTLGSANRAELIIKGGDPGRYRIYARAYDQGHPGGPRPTRLLGTLRVSGSPVSGRLPTRLVDPPRMPSLPVARRRRLVFTGDISGRHGPGVRFLIDGKEFDAQRVDQLVDAGTVEEWTLVNDSEQAFQHPIHVHVNPFQVVDVRGIPRGDTSWQTDPTIWWDTFRLPPKGSFTFRTFFRPDVTGRTVFHCHVLQHEDHSMMGTLFIAAPGMRPEDNPPSTRPNSGVVPRRRRRHR